MRTIIVIAMDIISISKWIWRKTINDHKYNHIHKEMLRARKSLA